MATKTKKQAPVVIGQPEIAPDKAIALLRKHSEVGGKLLSERPIQEDDYATWVMLCRNYLEKAPGSRYFCESFYGHPCPTSGKNYATAHACGGPSRPASFVGYPTRGIQHHSRNDSTRCRKACIFTTQKDAS